MDRWMDKDNNNILNAFKKKFGDKMTCVYTAMTQISLGINQCTAKALCFVLYFQSCRDFFPS